MADKDDTDTTNTSRQEALEGRFSCDDEENKGKTENRVITERQRVDVSVASFNHDAEELIVEKDLSLTFLLLFFAHNVFVAINLSLHFKIPLVWCDGLPFPFPRRRKAKIGDNEKENENLAGLWFLLMAVTAVL